MDNGQQLTYNQILDIDGYVNVHLSMQQLSVIVAQGEIGANELTGMSKIYPLNELAVPGIRGTITFEELGVIVSQGNIGSNVGAGIST